MCTERRSPSIPLNTRRARSTVAGCAVIGRRSASGSSSSGEHVEVALEACTGVKAAAARSAAVAAGAVGTVQVAEQRPHGRCRAYAARLSPGPWAQPRRPRLGPARPPAERAGDRPPLPILKRRTHRRRADRHQDPPPLERRRDPRRHPRLPDHPRTAPARRRLPRPTLPSFETVRLRFGSLTASTARARHHSR